MLKKKNHSYPFMQQFQEICTYLQIKEKVSEYDILIIANNTLITDKL